MQCDGRGAVARHRGSGHPGAAAAKRSASRAAAPGKPAPIRRRRSRAHPLRNLRAAPPKAKAKTKTNQKATAHRPRREPQRKALSSVVCPGARPPSSNGCAASSLRAGASASSRASTLAPDTHKTLACPGCGSSRAVRTRRPLRGGGKVSPVKRRPHPPRSGQRSCSFGGLDLRRRAQSAAPFGLASPPRFVHKQQQKQKPRKRPGCGRVIVIAPGPRPAPPELPQQGPGKYLPAGRRTKAKAKAKAKTLGPQRRLPFRESRGPGPAFGPRLRARE